jgi:predicted transcriptional regulator
MADGDKLSLITNVAASYLRRNSVGIDQIGTVMASVTRAVEQAAKDLVDGPAPAQTAATETAAARSPAVPVKRSVQREFIVCLEDGLKARTLKRHLQSAHGMTPSEYRAKWNLPRDYPMAAPAYSERRSAMAKELGLGKKMREARAQRAKGRRRGASG